MSPCDPGETGESRSGQKEMTMEHTYDLVNLDTGQVEERQPLSVPRAEELNEDYRSLGVRLRWVMQFPPAREVD
jgi:hypothetical protein